MLIGASTWANPIINGQTISPVPGASVSASAVQLGNEVNSLVKTSFGKNTEIGSLQSWVYTGDANNPYGGLTFVYQISLQSSSTTFVDSFADSTDWTGFKTAVGSKVSSGQVNSSSVNRDSDIITWVFSPTHVMNGNISALLIVETDAKKFTNDAFNMHDGATSTAEAYVPLAIPDGGLTSVLLGGALLALGALRRRMS